MTADKFITLTKYSYYESGSKWVKVILNLPGIISHSKEKITIDFTKRTLAFKVVEFKG